MGTTKTTSCVCPHCGEEGVGQALVCPKCHTILAKHSRQRTPAWVIALLSLIIVALLAYIVYLARNTFVLQSF